MRLKRLSTCCLNRLPNGLITGSYDTLSIKLGIKENVPEKHRNVSLYPLLLLLRRGKPRLYRKRTKLQCETAANSGEFIRDWNF